MQKIKNALVWIAIFAVLVSSLLATVPAAAQATQYPLTGLRFSSPEGTTYDAYWEANGRLWQPQLLSVMSNQRVAHTNAAKIAAGRYVFNGVVCKAFVDENREGLGSKSAKVVGMGNGLEFSVNPAPLRADETGETIPVAWMLVECQGGASSGFDVWSIDLNTQPGVQPAQTNSQAPAPTQTVNQPANPTPVPAENFTQARDRICALPGALTFTYEGGTYSCPGAVDFVVDNPGGSAAALPTGSNWWVVPLIAAVLVGIGFVAARRGPRHLGSIIAGVIAVGVGLYGVITNLWPAGWLWLLIGVGLGIYAFFDFFADFFRRRRQAPPPAATPAP